MADMKEEFVSEYVWKIVRAGCVYEDKYLLGTSIARPLLAKKQVEVALATGCDAPGARLHGQGQRSGALRAGLQGAGAAPASDRAVARVDDRFARGRDRVCPQAQRADRAKHDQNLLRATATSGTSRTKAASLKIRPTQRRRRSGC